MLLGTGTPNATPERSGSAIAIIVGEKPYLVDFGPGIVRRAIAAHQNGIEALRIQNLNFAFLTHMHSDHTAGYPDLILTPWVLGREEPLEVYGPPGTREMTENIHKAYQKDIDERLNGLEPANESGWRVNAHEIAPGLIYQTENLQVEAIPVCHGSWQAFGFKFILPDRTVVISGDTAPSSSLVEHAKDCDVLIHEVYSSRGFRTRPPEWQRYHSSAHTSALELAEIASKVKPGLLILTHQLFWGISEEELLEEVRSGYDGKVASGRDLEVY